MRVNSLVSGHGGLARGGVDVDVEVGMGVGRVFWACLSDG